MGLAMLWLLLDRKHSISLTHVTAATVSMSPVVLELLLHLWRRYIYFLLLFWLWALSLFVPIHLSCEAERTTLKHNTRAPVNESNVEPMF